MQLHLVGGFLGSGKTTAIISAAQKLIYQGKRVGIVTNDQGKFLVDTAFAKSVRIPTVEVTGGCFCCNYNNLETVLKQLEEDVQPDVIFAESVGSCADIVATVVKPLQTFYQKNLHVHSVSIFTDIRLLQRRLQNLPMPFHEDVIYIFDKQIEEAGLLVINKIDLLDAPDILNTCNLAKEKYPHMPIIAQSSLSTQSQHHWFEHIISHNTYVPTQSLIIDYDKYSEGETELAWLDEKIDIEVSPGEGRQAIICLLDNLLENIEQKGFPIGHLKIWVQTKEDAFKLSLTTPHQDDWQSQIPYFTSPTFTLLLNLRAQGPKLHLKELICESIEILCWNMGATCLERESDAFHPAPPTPVHRLE